MKTSSKVSMREETSDISVLWLVADKGRNSSHLAILLYNVDHHIYHNVHLMYKYTLQKYYNYTYKHSTGQLLIFFFSFLFFYFVIFKRRLTPNQKMHPSLLNQMLVHHPPAIVQTRKKMKMRMMMSLMTKMLKSLTVL